MIDWSDNIEQLRKKFFKYRLKPQYRKKFRIFAISAAAILLILCLWSPVADKIHSLTRPESYGRVKVDKYRDLNSLHLKYARRNGISAFKNSAALHKSLPDFLRKDRLVKIKSNKYYIVMHLSHSHPYLTPQAQKLLDDIGKRFHKKLEEKGMGKYKYQISSLLRTKESQKSLSRSNVNASSNTSHLYGTTFDIAYATIVKRPLPWMNIRVQDPKAIKCLSEAIGELRREGRCVVVTERIEKCFHITVKY